MANSFKTIKEYYEDMVSEITSRSEQINLIGDGTVLGSILQAISVQFGYLTILLKQCVRSAFIDTAKGDFLTAKASDWKVYRKEETHASTTIKLERVNTTSQLRIAPGQMFYTELDPFNQNKEYVLSTPIVFGVGESVATGTIVATTAGTEGNTLANTITVANPTIASITSITNEEDVTNGVDTETDNDLRPRLRTHMNGLMGANERSIRAAALSVTGVYYVFLKEHEVKPGIFYVYVNNKNGDIDRATISEVISAVNSVKAYGTTAVVTKSPVKLTTINIKIQKLNRLSDSTQLENKIKDLVLTYVNSLPPANALRISDLVGFIERIDGVDYVQNNEGYLELKLNGSHADLTTVSTIELIRTREDLINVEFIN